MCCFVLRLIISSLSFSRIVHLTRKLTLKISRRKKKCIRYSWFHWWDEMTQKQLTFFMWKTKVPRTFQRSFTLKGALSGANLVLIFCWNTFPFDKLSNWLETSYLVKGEKDKVGQSYKKKTQNCMAWHYDPPKKCIFSSFSLLYFRSSSY